MTEKPASSVLFQPTFWFGDELVEREERATTGQPRECARRRSILSTAVSAWISSDALRRRAVKANSCGRRRDRERQNPGISEVKTRL